MNNIVLELIKVARPIHWTKNISLFAAMVFSGYLMDREAMRLVFFAFISFSFISSAAYIINDIKDAPRDRKHPIKKHRPIASGALSPQIAAVESIFLASIAYILAVKLHHPLFTLSIVAYFLLQIAYSLFLKDIATIDILVIATGFIIRVYAGAFVINAHLSVWFLLCVISVALFLASGKRRTELNIVTKDAGTRKSLKKYTKELLNSYVTMFGNAAWLSWALYTFYEPTPVPKPVWLFLAELSRATTISKLLMITIPIVIYSIMRYESLIFAGKAEKPEKLFLTDKPLVASILIWSSMIIWILYIAPKAPIATMGNI